MISELTRKYRSERELTLAQFAQALMEKIPADNVSKQSVHHWESGKHRPAGDFLLLVAMRYGDWRRDWALNCLAVMRPDLYAPAEA